MKVWILQVKEPQDVVGVKVYSSREKAQAALQEAYGRYQTPEWGKTKGMKLDNFAWLSFQDSGYMCWEIIEKDVK